MIKVHLLNFIAHIRKRWLWLSVLAIMLAQLVYLGSLLRPSLRTRPLEGLYDHLAGVSALSPVAMRMAGRWHLMVSLLVLIMLLIGLLMLHAKKDWDAGIGLPDMLRSVDVAYNARSTFGFIGLAICLLGGVGVLFLILLVCITDIQTQSSFSLEWTLIGIMFLVVIVVSFLFLVDKASKSPVSAILVYVSYFPAGGILHFLADNGINLHGVQHLVYSFGMITQSVNYFSSGVVPGTGGRSPGLALIILTLSLLTLEAFRYRQIRLKQRRKNRVEPRSIS